ncbi:hypothetical protein ASG12_03330 [Williamsia sp. Leaf354]|uniref:hypothetical protein n=1 Tax=Williamsia sp. Leaf354 TaxID=1736349 RepID=UPI0006F2E159|nr:hypothetical protein [Williamsia sp. Leaf354]KQR99815.1 hypothetical protein ASG12_03330 [Williamsia sp. Leaf354]
MTFTLILILGPALVLALALADRRSRREAGLPTLDYYAGVLTDLGPDADGIRDEVTIRAARDRLGAHELSGTDTDTGFPGPRWLGVR